MRPWRALRSALGAGRRVGAQSETAGHDEHDAGQLIRRVPDRSPRPRPVSGPELRAFETLDTLFPVMAATIERARPMVTRVLDLDPDDLDDFDERAERELLSNLRALAWQAFQVSTATNTLRAGIDLLADEGR